MRVTFQSKSKFITLITIKTDKMTSCWDIFNISSAEIVITADLMTGSEQRIGEMRA